MNKEIEKFESLILMLSELFSVSTTQVSSLLLKQEINSYKKWEQDITYLAKFSEKV